MLCGDSIQFLESGVFAYFTGCDAISFSDFQPVLTGRWIQKSNRVTLLPGSSGKTYLRSFLLVASKLGPCDAWVEADPDTGLPLEGTLGPFTPASRVCD